MKWIKVSERLPDNFTSVIVCTRDVYDGTLKVTDNVLYYHNRGKPTWLIDDCCGDELDNLEYWMPLPPIPDNATKDNS